MLVKDEQSRVSADTIFFFPLTFLVRLPEGASFKDMKFGFRDAFGLNGKGNQVYLDGFSLRPEAVKWFQNSQTPRAERFPVESLSEDEMLPQQDQVMMLIESQDRFSEENADQERSFFGSYMAMDAFQEWLSMCASNPIYINDRLEMVKVCWRQLRPGKMY